MDGDKVQKKRFARSIQLEYNHDRLIEMKMVQVYQLLVPDKIWVRGNGQQAENQQHEAGRDICEGVLRSSKRRAHY
jgi:hypothetical protein